MALLAPYVGTGWEEAAETAAGFLAGEGRADDVFALLGPRVGDSYHARALIRLAEGLGRDEEVLELLPVVSPDRRAPHHAVELRARILERQGALTTHCYSFGRKSMAAGPFPSTTSSRRLIS